MRILSTAEFRKLAVVNLCGGEIIGYPCELEIDLDDGRVVALIIPQSDGFQLFGKRDERVIPWKCIECIGEDAILVKLDGEKDSTCSGGVKKRRKSLFFKT